MPEERLQKILARAGFGSRRASEKFISAGRVKVNGTVAELGSKADPSRDTILVDGDRISAEKDDVYLAFYKPRGVLSTTGGPDKRPKLIDLIPDSDKLQIVGRLDFESEGLILLTSDGELTNWLTHPRYGHEKEYRALVSRMPDSKQLATWKRGVVLHDGYRTRPVKIKVEKQHGSGAWLQVIMKEGRKRQIRETAALVGLSVEKLVRIRIASLKLGKLQVGQWRNLSEEEVIALRRNRKIA
jgi:23S rRNA pseudouridine2605 synthase